MKIVILDGYTLNPGDLSWENLQRLGTVTIYDRSPAEHIVERARGAEVLFTNKTPLTGEILAQLPALKYIGVLATGYNIVDTGAAKALGITVTNIPTYGTRSVAQMTLALLLELALHVQDHSTAVRSGAWSRSADFCFWDYPLLELADKTMGIIGCGRIGLTVADVAAAFGMRVLGYDSFQSDQSQRPYFHWTGLDELLRESDVVSLHCPLFPETRGIMNRTNLSKMKTTAFLLNTSRGPLVVEEDLAAALYSGAIAGAGLDVLAEEPPQADNPLLTARNCLITPHISWATKEARQRLMGMAVANLEQFLAGKPVNVVNR